MDEAQALDRLTRILDRPEFAFAERPFWERWWAALRDWLYDALWRLTTPVGEAATGRRGWLELLVLLVSLVLLAVRFYREHLTDVYGLGDRWRAVLYGALAVAVLAMAARRRLWETGTGTLLWLVLIVAASLALVEVVRRYRAYP
jgi:hypothetical protein